MSVTSKGNIGVVWESFDRLFFYLRQGNSILPAEKELTWFCGKRNKELYILHVIVQIWYVACFSCLYCVTLLKDRGCLSKIKTKCDLLKVTVAMRIGAQRSLLLVILYTFICTNTYRVRFNYIYIVVHLFQLLLIHEAE